MGVEFDSSRLDEIGAEAPGLVSELVALFSSDVADRLASLREAIESGDHESTKRAAHGIKGAAINIGAGGLATLAEAIEYGEQGVEPGHSTEEMQNEFEAVRAILVERYCG